MEKRKEESGKKEGISKAEKYEKPQIIKYSRKRRITAVAGATAIASSVATTT